MGDFRKLKVWKAAQHLTLLIYRSTARFPDSERYGLTSQMRRAANSISANLAEGCGRTGDREQARFARIAAGSAAELESHLFLARRLRLLAPLKADALLRETVSIRRRLYRLLNYLAGKSGRTNSLPSRGPSTTDIDHRPSTIDY